MAAARFETKVVEPRTTHTHTVIFLHGRGDSIENFTRSLPHSPDSQGRDLSTCFPSFRWVFPGAPLRQLARDRRVRMRQWFDVWSTADFSEREEVALEGLREVVPYVRGLVDEEAARFGGDHSRVVLAGISMGGATAAHVLFNLDVPRLGGLLAFSARCPFASRDLDGIRQVLGLDGVPHHNKVIADTPILIEHCTDDPLVPVAMGQRLRDVLAGFGAKTVVWKEYPQGGHWFKSPEGMDDAVEFLEKYVRSQQRA